MTRIEGVVRRATLDDLDHVLALERIAPVDHEHSDLVTSRMQSGDVILFEEHDQILGFAVVAPRGFFGRDFVELLTVAVDFRRRDMGSALLQEAVRTSSTNRIFTSTNQSNTPMIRLLDKARWRFSGQLDGIDEGDPELVYFKEIDVGHGGTS